MTKQPASDGCQSALQPTDILSYFYDYAIHFTKRFPDIFPFQLIELKVQNTTRIKDHMNPIANTEIMAVKIIITSVPITFIAFLQSFCSNAR